MKGHVMKTKLLAALMAGVSIVATLPGASIAQDQAKGMRSEEVIQDTVTVESVDVPNRLLTVKDSQGATQTLEIPASVKNFAQLKPGDKIRTHYKVALATQLLKPGSAATVTETQESMKTAPPGGKPGLNSQRVVKTVITVKDVDPVKNSFTFVGPKAHVRTVEVKDPDMQAKLKQLKAGDQIEVTFTEALAIDVQPAAK
jgi:Cu/Ag efflux protein CusF